MMNGVDSLLKMIPKIKRSRDFHVYDFSGRRYLDLWLDSGRAFLGHKYGRTVLMIKNSLEKGLSAAYPGVWENRLLNQLKLLYPQIKACSVVFAGIDVNLPLVRPFENDNPIKKQIFELLLPMPGSCMVKVLCCSSNSAKDLPQSSPIPQFMYTSLCRATADLVAFYKEVDYSRWNTFDLSFWERKGPWLYPKVTEDEYKKIFCSLLKKGVIISPYYSCPSCAPYRFTNGEILPIKKLSEEFY